MTNKAQPKRSEYSSPTTSIGKSNLQVMLVSKKNNVFVSDVCKSVSLMVREIDSGSIGPGSSPGRARCVVVLGKTLPPQCLSLRPGIGEFNAGNNPAKD